jgi:hypothetical protein
LPVVAHLFTNEIPLVDSMHKSVRTAPFLTPGWIGRAQS